MSEQDREIEAQKREDVLMDMYKLHAYIPNDAEGNPLTPFGNFCAGYEAATAEANKRIDALKNDNKIYAECNTTLKTENECLSSSCKSITEKYLELQASNNTLREALLAASRYVDHFDPASSICKIISEALSATPAESLQAFENEVIEKCAKVLEQMELIGGLDFAEAIRALKGE